MKIRCPHILLSCFILLTSLQAYAQDILNINAGAGPTLAVGEYASDNLNDSSAGFAGFGGIVNLTVGIKPLKNFGFCFYGALGMHDARTGRIEKEINERYGTTLKAGTSYYRFGIATGGLIVSGRVSEFFVLDGRVTAGYMWAENPTIEMRTESQIYYKKYSAPGQGLAISAGFGFRYIAYRSFYISGTADFIYGDMKFTNVITENLVGQENVTRQDTYHQFVGAISITGGIGVSF